MTYKIETGIPYTNKSFDYVGRYAANHTDALRRLNVGESFFIPCQSYEEVKNWQSKILGSLEYLHRIINYNGKTLWKYDYDTTIVIEGDTMGLRVWKNSEYRESEHEWISVAA
jgi:hypothetical protein